jgi:hypothetical protein
LLAMPVGKPRLFLVDKGYDGDLIREELLIHGIKPCRATIWMRSALPRLNCSLRMGYCLI